MSSSSSPVISSINPIKKVESQFKTTDDILTKSSTRSINGKDKISTCDCNWNGTQKDHTDWITVSPANQNGEDCKYSFKSQPRKLQDILSEDYELPENKTITSWELDFKIPIKKGKIKIIIDPNDEYNSRWIYFNREKNGEVRIFYGEGQDEEDGKREIKTNDNDFGSGKLNHFKFRSKDNHFMLLKSNTGVGDPTTVLWNSEDVNLSKGWGDKFLYSESEIAIHIESNTSIDVRDLFFKSNQIKKKRSESSKNPVINTNHVSKNEVYFLAVWNRNFDDSLNGKSIDLGNAPGDQARRLSEAYRKLGVKIIDPIIKFEDKEDLRLAIEHRQEFIKKADVLIVHYGGHGAIIEKDDVLPKHRLIPENGEVYLKTDETANTINDNVPTTEFFINELKKHLLNEKKKLLDVTIDACRNSIYLNPEPNIGRDLFGTNTSYNFKKLKLDDGNAKIFTVLRYSVPKYQKAKNSFGYTDCHINSLKDIKPEVFNNTSMNEIFMVKGNVNYPPPICWDHKGALSKYQLEQYLQNFKLTKNFNEYINEFFE